MSEKCNEHSGASMSVCPYCKIEELREEANKETIAMLAEFSRANKAELECDSLRGVLEDLQTQIQQVNDGDRPYTGFDTELIDEALDPKEIPIAEIKMTNDTVFPM